jgi:pimeloyl-ACP methyl ester carboxylesterase
MSNLLNVGFEHRTWNGPGGMVIEELGEGPRVVLVHGGGTGGTIAWQRQLPLAERYRLVIPWRPGYGPSPAAPREDFEREAGLVAELIGDGAHLVGQSYGGVVALLAAAQRSEAVRSLALVEPGAIAVARGYPLVDAFEAALQKVAREHRDGDPETFLRATFAVLDPGVALPDPLPPPLRVAAERLRTLRPPSEAVIPVEELRAAPFPKLVVNGSATGAAFVTIAEVLAERIGAERFVVAGAGHAAQLAGDRFNPRLEAFLAAAEQLRRG